MIKASLYFVAILVVGLIAFALIAVGIVAAIVAAVGESVAFHHDRVRPKAKAANLGDGDLQGDLVSALVNLGYRRTFARELVARAIADGRVAVGEPVESALAKVLKERR